MKVLLFFCGVMYSAGSEDLLTMRDDASANRLINSAGSTRVFREIPEAAESAESTESSAFILIDKTDIIDILIENQEQKMITDIRLWYMRQEFIAREKLFMQEAYEFLSAIEKFSSSDMMIELHKNNFHNILQNMCTTVMNFIPDSDGANGMMHAVYSISNIMTEMHLQIQNNIRNNKLHNELLEMYERAENDRLDAKNDTDVQFDMLVDLTELMKKAE